MSEKFTPGPWSVSALDSLLRFGRKNSGRWDDEVGVDEYMPDEDDTHLIAAAPEMYKTLKSYCDRWCHNGVRSTMDKCGPCSIGKVLKKARGEEQMQNKSKVATWRPAVDGDEVDCPLCRHPVSGSRGTLLRVLDGHDAPYIVETGTGIARWSKCEIMEVK